MADPLSISTGQGKGAAQVFRPGLTPEMGLEYQLGKKQAADEAKAAAQKQRQKAKDDALKTIDDVALGGWVGNLPELESQKEFLINKMADNYIKNPNYDPTVDREMRLATSQLKANVLANKGKEDWIKSTVPFQQKSDDFEGWEEVRRVQQGGLGEYNNYIKEHGSAPYPTPKKELLNYDKAIKDIFKGLGAKVVTTETPLAEGGTRLVGSKKVPMSTQDEAVTDFVNSGINGRVPEAVQFVEDIKTKLSGETIFRIAPPEKQAKMIMDEAKKETLRKGKQVLDEEYSDKLQGQGQGAAGEYGKSYDFSKPSIVKSEGDIYHGEGQEYEQVTLTKIKGGNLPSGTYKNSEKQDVTGVPTGEFLKAKKSGKVTMSVAVPNKSLTLPSDYAGMTDEEKASWFEEQFNKDPNKFKVVPIPLDIDFNKNKVKGSFGKNPEEIFGTQSETKKNDPLGIR